MKDFDEWKIPDHEQHLIEWMGQVRLRVHGRLAYQYSKYAEAKKYIQNFGQAIDVGAHIGLWSYYMAHDFVDLIAFEPMPIHAECWKENMKGMNNAVLWPYALGDKEDFVWLATRTPDSSGDTGVCQEGTAGAVQVPQKTLDFFNFDDVDFIKLDCEGYEEFALRGGEKMLMDCKPVILVEQKGRMSEQYGLSQKSAVDYLTKLGFTLQAEMSGDYILSWE